MKYDFTAIEQKWHKIWEEQKLYQAETGADKKKFYALIEFPYPSGVGLHVGHARPYTAMDVIARKHRMQGENVLFPMGNDAFGLRHQEPHPPRHRDEEQHRDLPRSAPGARLQLRLGQRDQHDRSELF